MTTDLMVQHKKRWEDLSWYSGWWAKCRKSFKCQNHGCANTVNPGEWCYYTGDKDGSHYWADVRFCRECAERLRGRTS